MIWRKTRVKKAFTLIELLVVIAIIMMLAGLIFPAIKGARERSREVVCKNNLKQLQVATLSYAINNGGGLPGSKSTESWDPGPACPHGVLKSYRQGTGWIDWVNYECHHNSPRDNDNDRKPGETPWWGPKGLTCITNGTLWEYVKSTKAYACPEWSRKDVCGEKDPEGGSLTFSSTNNKPWRSYAMNSQVSGRNIGDIECSKYILFTELGNTNFLTAAATNRVSERNMTEKFDYSWDKGSRTEADGWDGSLTCTTESGKEWPRENVGLYHKGKANAVFVDGHVEKVAWNVTTNAASGNW